MPRDDPFSSTPHRDAAVHPRFQVPHHAENAPVGMVPCTVLIATLPVWSVLVGLGVFAVGMLGRLAQRRFS